MRQLPKFNTENEDLCPFPSVEKVDESGTKYKIKAFPKE